MAKKEPLGNLRRPTPAAPPALENQVLGEPIRRNRPEPRATITVQLPFELDIQLEERAHQLGIKKRDLIVAGIQMALQSKEFSA